MPGQLEIGASPAQLGEIAPYRAERSVELHPHRHHSITRHHLGVPDPTVLIGVLIAVRVDDDVLSRDLAHLRRTGEVLVPLGR